MLSSIPKIQIHLFFSFFQRLVEAAEDAYLKHEFDADLQVIFAFSIFIIRVCYKSLYNTLGELNCCRKPSMWVIEGCWLQEMELMKAGSVFWQVTDTGCVLGDLAGGFYSERFLLCSLCLPRSSYLNPVISSMFHPCSAGKELFSRELKLQMRWDPLG